jgi:hypothetical protein
MPIGKPNRGSKPDSDSDANLGSAYVRAAATLVDELPIRLPGGRTSLRIDQLCERP